MFQRTHTPKPTAEDFIYAARVGDLNTVKRYIALNKNNTTAINATDERGFTALIWAACNGHATVVDTLLGIPNININATNKYGNTALSLAAGNEFNTPIVQSLLNYKPSIAIDIADSDGDTALISAAREDNEEMVLALIDHKADITLQNKNQLTAEQEARQKGNTNIANVLAQQLKAPEEKRSASAFFIAPKAKLSVSTTHLEPMDDDNTPSPRG